MSAGNRRSFPMLDTAVSREANKPGAHGPACVSESVRRPRLLFLSYYFPPVNTIGAVRALNVAKWLTRVGWEVTVVTLSSSVWTRTDNPEGVDAFVRQEGIRCLRTDHPHSSLSSTSLMAGSVWVPRMVEGGIRRIARFLGIDDQRGWLSEAKRACAGLVADDVDVILATGPPFVAFQLAQRLAVRLKVPFVLDYRDLWTGNPHASAPGAKRFCRMERALLEQASAVTVVSPSLGKSLAEGFGVERKVHVISNGYDREDLAQVAPQEFGHFAIVYAGTFYPPKRVITPFIDALQRLRESARVPPSAWRFHYYGPQPEHVRDAASAYRLESNVEIHGIVPRSVVLSALRGAGMSLVVTSVSEQGTLQDKSIVTGKIFEALGTGTPSLVIAPPGSDLEDILQTTGLGQRFTGGNREEMAAFLENAILGRGPRPSNGEIYEWSSIVQRLDALLRSLREPSA